MSEQKTPKPDPGEFETAMGLEFYHSFCNFLSFYSYLMLLDILKKNNSDFDAKQFNNQVVATWSDSVRDHNSEIIRQHNEAITTHKDTGGDDDQKGDTFTGGQGDVEIMDPEDLQTELNESLKEARAKVVEQLNQNL